MRLDESKKEPSSSGGLHNARRADDGQWVWGYDVMDRPVELARTIAAFGWERQDEG